MIELQMSSYVFIALAIAGVISLVALAGAIAALYGYRLAGSWRWIYVVSALLSLYLNIFVLIVQAFQKISLLNALAPTQSESPFAVVQAVVLVIFVAVTVLAARSFRPKASRPAFRSA
jgi:MFS family permease